jgi:hypothetical protein
VDIGGLLRGSGLTGRLILVVVMRAADETSQPSANRGLSYSIYVEFHVYLFDQISEPVNLWTVPS